MQANPISAHILAALQYLGKPEDAHYTAQKQLVVIDPAAPADVPRIVTNKIPELLALRAAGRMPQYLLGLEFHATFWGEMEMHEVEALAERLAPYLKPKE